MSRLRDMANAVMTELSDLHAEMSFNPFFELKDCKKLRIVVVPAAQEVRSSTRGTMEREIEITVGILKRVDKNSDIEPELQIVETIMDRFSGGVECGNMPGYICSEADNVIPYDNEALRTENMFKSVISLTFKEY